MTTKTNVDVNFCDYCCAAELQEASGGGGNTEQMNCKTLDILYRGISLQLKGGHFCGPGCLSAYLTKELIERAKETLGVGDA